jgi:hypothetical protein
LLQFHYNSKLLSSGILLRAEEMDDYFATLDFNDLNNFKT